MMIHVGAYTVHSACNLCASVLLMRHDVGYRTGTDNSYTQLPQHNPASLLRVTAVHSAAAPQHYAAHPNFIPHQRLLQWQQQQQTAGSSELHSFRNIARLGLARHPATHVTGCLPSASFDGRSLQFGESTL